MAKTKKPTCTLWPRTIGSASCLLTTAIALAASTMQLTAGAIDFEGLPATYIYSSGDQNIGTYYAGLDFEANVTGLDLTGSTAFPPHSGSIAVWDPVDLAVTISFSTPESMVGLWYTSLDLLTLDAYDSGNNLRGETIGSANTDGTTGTSDFLSVTAANINSITLTGPPGGYVFDDLTFTPQGSSPVPEPSTGFLLGSAALVWLFVRGARKPVFSTVSIASTYQLEKTVGCG